MTKHLPLFLKSQVGCGSSNATHGNMLMLDMTPTKGGGRADRPRCEARAHLILVPGEHRREEMATHASLAAHSQMRRGARYLEAVSIIARGVDAATGAEGASGRVVDSHWASSRMESW